METIDIVITRSTVTTKGPAKEDDHVTLPTREARFLIHTGRARLHVEYNKEGKEEKGKKGRAAPVNRMIPADAGETRTAE